MVLAQRGAEEGVVEVAVEREQKGNDGGDRTPGGGEGGGSSADVSESTQHFLQRLG